MARKRDTAEQILGKRREAEGALAQGAPVAQGARRRGVTEQTADRGRREDGGLRGDQAKRRKERERENARRKRCEGGLRVPLRQAVHGQPQGAGRRAVHGREPVSASCARRRRGRRSHRCHGRDPGLLRRTKGLRHDDPGEPRRRRRAAADRVDAPTATSTRDTLRSESAPRSSTSTASSVGHTDAGGRRRNSPRSGRWRARCSCSTRPRGTLRT